MKNIDEKYMALALKEAAKAALIDEVPVGAVIVLNEKVIAKAYNKKEINKDTLGHAELLAIRKANRKINAWRLSECVLYVTLEPCAMCSGAIMHARFKKVVYGARDLKGGAMGDNFNLFEQKPINHKPEIVSGVLEEECSNILKEFFKTKRNH